MVCTMWQQKVFLLKMLKASWIKFLHNWIWLLVIQKVKRPHHFLMKFENFVHSEGTQFWSLSNCTIGILQKKCLNIEDKGLSTNYVISVGGGGGGKGQPQRRSHFQWHYYFITITIFTYQYLVPLVSLTPR